MSRIFKIARIRTKDVTVEEAEDARAACYAAGWLPEWCEVVDIIDAVKKLEAVGDRKMKLDLEKVTEMIRTEEDPEKLVRELKAMVEETFPVQNPTFTDGEIIPLHEFESRFKNSFCQGNETTFAQWPVRVFYDTDGSLMIQLTQPIDLTEVEE